MIFNLDKLFNYLFYKLGNYKLTLNYINNQEIFSKVPKLARAKIFKRIYISRKHRLVFFLIPKNANTTIKHALNLNLEKKHSDNYFLSKLLSNNFKDFKKAIILRDPFQRFKSLYFDKIINKVNKNYYFNNIEDLLTKLQQKDFILINQHWIPQENYLLNNTHFFDFIGKVENLDKDFFKLLSIINVEQKYTLKKLNSSQISQKKNEDKQIELDAFKKKIYEIYSNDYKYWKYF